MQSIELLPRRITVLIIAHRLSTLKNCDYLVELGKPAAASESSPVTAA
jgi:ABC-type multidrug transport system fused ATPase/permease subunit